MGKSQNISVLKNIIENIRMHSLYQEIQDFERCMINQKEYVFVSDFTFRSAGVYGLESGSATIR